MDIINALKQLTNLELFLSSLLFFVYFILMIKKFIKKKKAYKNEIKEKFPKLNDLIYKYDNRILEFGFIEIYISLLFF